MDLRKAYYQEYLPSMKDRWSGSTLRSERARLAHVDFQQIQDPGQVYQALMQRGIALYSVKTVFMRLSSFYNWLIYSGHISGTNPYKDYLYTHANKFKAAKKRRAMPFTPEEVVARVAQIEDVGARRKAEQLLLTGMRWSESLTLKQESPQTWWVRGKGNKVRQVFLPAAWNELNYTAPYKQFLNHLKRVGLTPHMLRKAAATRALHAGASLPDLLALFGWSSAETALSYLREQSAPKLAKFMELT